MQAPRKKKKRLEIGGTKSIPNDTIKRSKEKMASEIYEKAGEAGLENIEEGDFIGYELTGKNILSFDVHKEKPKWGIASTNSPVLVPIYETIKDISSDAGIPFKTLLNNMLFLILQNNKEELIQLAEEIKEKEKSKNTW